jgi:hypothetical protein
MIDGKTIKQYGTINQKDRHKAIANEPPPTKKVSITQPTTQRW